MVAKTPTPWSNATDGVWLLEAYPKNFVRNVIRFTYRRFQYKPSDNSWCFVHISALTPSITNVCQKEVSFIHFMTQILYFTWQDIFIKPTYCRSTSAIHWSHQTNSFSSAIFRAKTCNMVHLCAFNITMHSL